MISWAAAGSRPTSKALRTKRQAPAPVRELARGQVKSGDMNESMQLAEKVAAQLARHLTDVVLCPGSRNAPLSLALLARDDIRVHTRLDERVRRARGAEMDARLALRTAEERVRGLAGRADSLRLSSTRRRYLARPERTRWRVRVDTSSSRLIRRPAAAQRPSGPQLPEGLRRSGSQPRHPLNALRAQAVTSSHDVVTWRPTPPFATRDSDESTVDLLSICLIRSQIAVWCRVETSHSIAKKRQTTDPRVKGANHMFGPDSVRRRWSVDEVTVTHPDVIKRAIGAAAIGNITEWYDFGVYSYMALTIGDVIMPLEGSAATLMTYALMAVAFLFRPLGGIILGPLSDRIGRNKVLAMTMIMMAGATVAIGLIPDYAHAGVWACVLLFLCRVLRPALQAHPHGQ